MTAKYSNPKDLSLDADSGLMLVFYTDDGEPKWTVGYSTNRIYHIDTEQYQNLETYSTTWNRGISNSMGQKLWKAYVALHSQK